MDDPLQELLESPLDEPQRRRGWLVGVLLVAGLAGLVGYVALARPEDPPLSTPTTVSASATNSASPATPVPDVAPGLVPPTRSYGILAPMPATDRLVLFGGTTKQGGLGSYVGVPWTLQVTRGAWMPLDGAVGPAPRVGHALTYVDSLGGVVMFGGGGTAQLDRCLLSCVSGFLGDMWLLDEATDEWEELLLSEGPEPRTGHAMVYDPVTDKVLLFGGLGAPEGASRKGTLHDDTWLFDPSTMAWRSVPTYQKGPMARAFHEMVYDEATGSALLWGGRWYDGTIDPKVMRFDFATESWTSMDVGDEPQPEPRWHHVWAAEPQSGLVVLAGGEWFDNGQRRFGSDVWTYDPATSTWTRRADLGGPVVWATAAPSGDGTVTLYVHGETGVYDPTSDTWRWLPTNE